MMNTNKTIDFIMPVYNEGEIIESEIRDLISFLSELDVTFEIIVVENGSSDDTPHILEQLSNEFEPLSVLHKDAPNVGRAKRIGLQEATNDWAVIVHADLWDKTFIQRSLSLLPDVDLVQSSKQLNEADDERPFFRYLLTWGFTFLLRWLVDFEGTDTRGLKAMNRTKILPVINKCKTERGMFETELVIRCQKEGYSKKEIPISIDYKRKPRNYMIKKISQNVVDIVKLAWIINREY